MTTLAYNPAIFGARPGFVLPRGATTTAQPQYPAQIDWSNPICRGLAHAVNAPFLVDAASLAPITGVGRPPAGSSVGLSRAQVSNKDYSFKIADNKASRSNEYTALCLFRRIGSGDAFAEIFSRSYNNGLTPPYISWTIGFNPSGLPGYQGQNSLFCARGNSVGNTNVNGNVVNGFDLSNWTVVVTVGKLSSFELWVNGALKDSKAFSGSTVYGNGAGNSISTAAIAADGGTRISPTETACGYVWNRALTDAEIRSISANPWQVFR